MLTRLITATTLAGLLAAALNDAPSHASEGLETVEFVLAVDGPPTQLDALSEALLDRLDRHGIRAAAKADIACGRVAVEVGAGEDIETVRSILSPGSAGAGALEFRRVVSVGSEAACRAQAHGPQACVSDEDGRTTDQWLLTEPAMVLDETPQTDVGFNMLGEPELFISLGGGDRERLCAVTTEAVGRSIAAVIGDTVVINAIVREPICGGSLTISGSYTEEELTSLADRIALAQLPAYEIWAEALVTRRPIPRTVFMPETAPGVIIERLGEIVAGTDLAPEAVYAALRAALGALQAPNWANEPPHWVDRRYFFEN